MVLPFGSAIPGALANFLTIAAAALPEETSVYYGSAIPYTAPYTLQITEISGNQEPATIGPWFRREETFALICSLSYYQGGTGDPQGSNGFELCLANVMTYFSTLALAVSQNPQLDCTDLSSGLGPAVRFAEVGNFHLEPETDANGMVAVTLDFQVRCSQRIRTLSNDPG
jgi:hypothetical protein